MDPVPGLAGGVGEGSMHAACRQFLYECQARYLALGHYRAITSLVTVTTSISFSWAETSTFRVSSAGPMVQDL